MSRRWDSSDWTRAAADMTRGKTPADMKRDRTADVTRSRTADMTRGRTADVTRGKTADVTRGRRSGRRYVRIGKRHVMHKENPHSQGRSHSE